MDLLTVYLYGSAGIVVGLLALSAAQNRRSGWRKSRGSFSEALDDVYADLGLSLKVPNRESNHVIVRAGPGVTADFSAFSNELINLDKALGSGQTITAAEGNERGEELFTAPSSNA
jgi:hypothetical protein